MASRCSQIRRELAKRSDGAIEVVTKGQGAGPFPAINDTLGPCIFSNVDRELIDAARVRELVFVFGEVVDLANINSALRQCEDD